MPHPKIHASFHAKHSWKDVHYLGQAYNSLDTTCVTVGAELGCTAVHNLIPQIRLGMAASCILGLLVTQPDAQLIVSMTVPDLEHTPHIQFKTLYKPAAMFYIIYGTSFVAGLLFYGVINWLNTSFGNPWCNSHINNAINIQSVAELLTIINAFLLI